MELVRSGRLEITTGGWVMTDEAVTRIGQMTSQLVEGHQWVKNTLNVSVVSGWSVDPFGHGLTMPYLLKLAGIDQTVILRTPYVWKKFLASEQAGDFYWQQSWDTGSGETSVLTHHHPYFMYTTSAACGPFGESTRMCYNFDFARDTHEPVAWYREFTHVTDENIQERAEMLIEAAGRTASLFPHNTALIMLGADFQFKHDSEWREQYGNYSRLMDYINRNTSGFNAQVVFATPGEYFTTVKQRMASLEQVTEYGPGEKDQESRGDTEVVYEQAVIRNTLPTLVGDFHVYSDVFDGKPKYWSGYYTTGPQWKRAGRQIETLLHAVESLHAWTLASTYTMYGKIYNNQRTQSNKLDSSGSVAGRGKPQETGDNDKSEGSSENERVLSLIGKCSRLLSLARKNVALFSHHDAITGTSSDSVMSDFINKIQTAHQQLNAVASGVLVAQLFDWGRFKDNALEAFASVEQWRLGILLDPLLADLADSQSRQVSVYNPLSVDGTFLLELLVPRNVRKQVKLVDHQGAEVLLTLSTAAGQNVRLQANVPLQAMSVNFFTLATVSHEISQNGNGFAKISKNDKRLRPPQLDERHITHMNGETTTLQNTRFTLHVQQLNHSASIQLRLVDKMASESSSAANFHPRGLGLNKNVIESELIHDSSVWAINVSFGAFRTLRGENGKYLFGMSNTGPDDTTLFECDSNSRLRAESRFSSSMRVTCGPIQLAVELLQERAALMSQAVSLTVDVKLGPEDTDTDVFMRFDTSLNTECGVNDKFHQSNDTVNQCGASGFYTDANDYMTIQRVWADKAGIPGNMYPVTSQATLQECANVEEHIKSNRVISQTCRRVSILMDRSRAVGSLASGSVTLTLDRRSSGDDQRGIGQANRANKLTRSKLLLAVSNHQSSTAASSRSKSATVVESLLARQLNQPPVVHMAAESTPSHSGRMPPLPPNVLKLIDRPLPCDWRILQLRTINAGGVSNNTDVARSNKVTLLLSLWRQPVVQCSVVEQTASSLGCSPPSPRTTTRLTIAVSALVPCGLAGDRPQWRRAVTDLDQVTLDVPGRVQSFLVMLAIPPQAEV